MDLSETDGINIHRTVFEALRIELRLGRMSKLGVRIEIAGAEGRDSPPPHGGRVKETTGRIA
jgi:hypothetical protein